MYTNPSLDVLSSRDSFLDILKSVFYYEKLQGNHIYISEVSSDNYSIKFLGMDWFISPAEVTIKMKSNNPNWYVDKESKELARWLPFDTSDLHDIYGQNEFTIPYYWMSMKGKDVKVAGYEVASVDLLFLPSYSLQPLSISNTDYRLYRAKYSLDTKKGEYEYDMDLLTQKLTDLYGVPTSISLDPPNTKQKVEKAIYWVKEDGSAVSLQLTPNRFLNTLKTITIHYGIVSDSQQVKDLIYIQQELKENDENRSNYDGL